MMACALGRSYMCCRSWYRFSELTREEPSTIAWGLPDVSSLAQQSLMLESSDAMVSTMFVNVGREAASGCLV